MIEKIKYCFDTNSVLYSNHAKIEMRIEEFGKIKDIEVYESINSGEIIEEYDKDKPYPSYLIYGKTKLNRPLHIVCAYNSIDDLVIVITVYQPDPKLWYDYKRRK
jgi:hypothetical protein